MHDPMTVAHEIRWPLSFKKNSLNGEKYFNPLITIWHVDPEKDGTDDSCGWFIRQRHLPNDLIEKVKKGFEFEFKHNSWFNESGYPKFSTSGVCLDMYSRAAWNVFMWLDGNRPSDSANRRYKKFMRKYLFDILHFAENPTDSLHNSINMTYGVEKKDERINHFVSVVVSDIMRKLRPWYKHPRWHINHWKIQFHPLQNFKRRYFDKCCICGKRGFKNSPMSDWDGAKMWHQECDRSIKPQIVK
jgi:hypothetical protein